MDEREDGESVKTGGDVIEHDACAGGQVLNQTYRRGFEDVEEAEEQEGDDGVGPVGRAEDKGDELAGDLVDDDVAGIFKTGLAGDDGRGWDTDERGDDCSQGRAEGEVRGVKRLGEGEPDDQRGGRAVGSGAGFEQARSEEGAGKPGPAGLFFGRRMDLGRGVGHENLV